MEKQYDFLYKILYVGDACTGKSSLILRATDDAFSESYITTIGVDFKVQTLNIDGKVVKLQIWDTAGQERFKAITMAYYKGASLIVLVFDTTNLESFENLRKWHQDVQNYSVEGVKLLVVGNKTDLGDKRTVPCDTAVRFAEEIGAGYLEASAQNKFNVNRILHVSAQYCMNTRDPSQDREETTDDQNQTTTTTTTTTKTTETTTPIGDTITPTTYQKEKEYDYLFKILVVGVANTGKSSVLQRYVDNTFSDAYISTIGVEFRVRTLDVYGKKVKLQIWDTAGQERFRAIAKSYYKGAHGFLLVYDITNKESFEKLQAHMDEIKTCGPEKMRCMVVGNKTDLESKREVSYDEGRAFAEEIGAGFWEVSAKNKDNIEELFIRMSCDLTSAQ